MDLRRRNERLDDREEKFGKTKLRKKKKNEKIGRKKKELLRETNSETQSDMENLGIKIKGRGIEKKSDGRGKL